MRLGMDHNKVRVAYHHFLFHILFILEPIKLVSEKRLTGHTGPDIRRELCNIMCKTIIYIWDFGGQHGKKPSDRV